MGPTATLRFRRSAAQLHALVHVEREIRASDPHYRRKYLRDFNTAFQRYESVLEPAELAREVAMADILLVGDYHSLPASQRFTGELLIEVARERPVVLGVETVFARHQSALDDWLNDEIDEQELRERIRFDLDWSYDWAPFFALLTIAREHSDGIYGLDCMPRKDLRRITVRDRHAATKIAEIRERHPEAAVVVLFGESHLAPNHLPAPLRAQRPRDRILTVLQNVDPLYWMAAGEPREQVSAVRVASDVVCVFNSTPLDKYESYRLCIEQWRQGDEASPDLAPSFYNLVDALSRFLNIDKYSATNHTQPVFLVDQLPDVYYRPSHERIRRLLQGTTSGSCEVPQVLTRLDEHGCCYVPQAHALLVRSLEMAHGAEEAARFIHHACGGPACGSTLEDRFYGQVLQDALGYFGSRALYPARPAVRESGLRQLRPAGTFSAAEFAGIVDFLVLHKQYEANLRNYRERPKRLNDIYEGTKAVYAARQLGYMLGSELYDAYISGHLARRLLRSLFFQRLDRPGAARTLYFATQRKLRQTSS